MDYSHPAFVLAAVERIYSHFPDIIGNDWLALQPQIDTYIYTLKNEPTAYVSTQLIGLLVRHESARQRLIQELIVQHFVAAKLDAPLTEIPLDESLMGAMLSAVSWEVDVATVPLPEDATRVMRNLTLKEGGVDGGRSIKFKNFEIDLTKMMTVGAGFMLAGQDMLDKPTPFMLAGGILVMVGTLLNEMTVKIEQQEATVFWGMIQATGTMHGAGLREQTIVQVTNAERAKHGLDALTEQQVRASLIKLKQLNSIVQSGDVYRIVEKFKVKG